MPDPTLGALISLTPTRRTNLRAAALGAFAGALVFALVTRGIPLEREQVLAWMLAGVVAASIGSSWLTIGRAVRDWVLFGVLFLLYDFSRGAAEELGMPVQVELPIWFDRVLFPGDVPTVELQERWRPFTGERWWEVMVSLVYVSHFIVPYVITAVYWLRDRTVWRQWLARFSTLTVAGLLTYVLVPTMPPWLAARTGELAPVERIAGRGWRAVGLESADRALDKGQAAVNLVAALPSLHAAYPALIAAFFWTRAPVAWRPVLAAYPLLMAFTLVVSGEHYVFDVLVGWLYVAVVMVAWARIDQR
ncbi:MAG: phosphatase PAP2 family protein, partial [Acidimicrobiales bacterium]